MDVIIARFHSCGGLSSLKHLVKMLARISNKMLGAALSSSLLMFPRPGDFPFFNFTTFFFTSSAVIIGSSCPFSVQTLSELGVLSS